LQQQPIIFETRGLLKALVDANSDHILAFTAFAAEAGAPQRPPAT
jgi:hypothetical protein